MRQRHKMFKHTQIIRRLLLKVTRKFELVSPNKTIHAQTDQSRCFIDQDDTNAELFKQYHANDTLPPSYHWPLSVPQVF